MIVDCLSISRRNSMLMKRKNHAVVRDAPPDRHPLLSSETKPNTTTVAKPKCFEPSPKKEEIIKLSKRSVAIFDPNEIKIGKLLGEGSFCEVYSVNSIRLKATLSSNSNSNSATSSWTSQEIQVRILKRSVCNTTTSDKDGIYAIKLLKMPTKYSPQKRQQRNIFNLLKEAQILCLLNHENIVQIHGVGKTTAAVANTTNSHTDFFIMIDQLRYTLKDKLLYWRSGSESVPTVTQKVKLAYQISKALAYIHKKGIIYRDLKPQNIGFAGHGGDDEDSHLKLFDFGSSRKLPTTAIPNHNAEEPVYLLSFAGSPTYMAPEVFLSSKKRYYNTKVDVYSWSIVVYELLTLQSAYNNNNNPDSAQQNEEEKETAALNYDIHKHKAAICKLGIRPDINPLIERNVPESIIHLLQNSWCHSISKRLTMKDVCHQLKAYRL